MTSRDFGGLGLAGPADRVDQQARGHDPKRRLNFGVLDPISTAASPPAPAALSETIEEVVRKRAQQNSLFRLLSPSSQGLRGFLFGDV